MAYWVEVPSKLFFKGADRRQALLKVQDLKASLGVNLIHLRRDTLPWGAVETREELVAAWKRDDKTGEWSRTFPRLFLASIVGGVFGIFDRFRRFGR